MQIFGGLAYTKGGQGEKVERLYRDAKAYSCVALLFPARTQASQRRFD